MRKAIFIDKDGTLIPDIPFNVDPELITISDNSVDGLKALQREGYLLVIITNQPGITNKYFSEDQLMDVLEHINRLLYCKGVYITGVEYCPHAPEEIDNTIRITCNCRKPLPGLLYRAARNHNIDLSSSWMLGDILNDVEAGNRAGCRSILINNGNETEWMHGPFRIPHRVVSTIDQAAAVILGRQTERNGLVRL